MFQVKQAELFISPYEAEMIQQFHSILKLDEDTQKHGY